MWRMVLNYIKDKATAQQRKKMAEVVKYFDSLKPHYSEDDKLILDVKNSKINEISRIEQKTHVIPIHRAKFVFCPIVWRESLQYQYDLAKTLYLA